MPINSKIQAGTNFSVWPFMTESKIFDYLLHACSPVRRFSCLVLFCAFFMLNGCSSWDIPGFSKDEDKEQTALQDKIDDLRETKPQPTVVHKNIFGKSLRSPTERMDRLERAVQDLRNDFDGVAPSINRLSSMENEIQGLVRELKQLNRDEGPAPVQSINNRPNPLVQQPIAPKPVVQNKTAYQPPPAATPQQDYQKKSPPPVENGMASVFDLRVGEHPGSTRIVMDVNNPTNFNVDIDNNENIMIIELPKAGWSAATSKSFSNSSFLSSYKVEKSGDGQMLIMQLKRGAKVTYKGDLKGVSGNSRRLVIDLGAV